MPADNYKVSASMPSPAVDRERLGFDDTSELEPLTETIGQQRAVEALEFGLQGKSAARRLEEMAQAVAGWGEGEVKSRNIIADCGDIRAG